jgi:fatty acid desaturase
MANVIRNVWSNAVIFCGHFPDGAEKFTKRDVEGETKGQWYLRQMLGSSNIDAGPVMAFMTGSLSYQIEHHLYPDLPSNRLAEISVRVRQVCEKYDLPYTTGSLLVQYGKAWRTIAKLSLPSSRRPLPLSALNTGSNRAERRRLPNEFRRTCRYGQVQRLGQLECAKL